MRVFVLTGDQTELTKFVLASTTTDRFVAQEMIKPNPLVCTPNLGPLVRNTGFGSNHGAVWRPPKVVSQPVVPGK